MTDLTVTNVLVVEDSEVSYTLLERILSHAPGLRVVGWAKSGEEALALVPALKPDVITMDIHMNGIDGYETTRQIMERHPLPIVIVSATYDPRDVMQAFRALEAGAVAMTGKPPGLLSPEHGRAGKRLVEMVKSMAEVRIGRRSPRTRVAREAALLSPERASAGLKRTVGVVAIGASTGGPQVLAEILEDLPKPFPVPILVVQQIAPGFMHGLAEWLSEKGGLPVRVARHGERALPGTVYLAPDGVEMQVDAGGLLQCETESTAERPRQTVARLFHSVADAFGPCAVGIMLTGSGIDGVEELKLMRYRGAVTFAQDRGSSIVYGSPGAAAKAGAAVYVLPPHRIAASIADLVMPGPGAAFSN